MEKNTYIMRLGIIVLFLLALNCQTAFSQPCLSDIEPEKSQIGYKLRKNDMRCEGTYKQKVAAVGNIEVIGLLKGCFNFKLDKNEVVEISSPIVKERPIYVCALPFQIKTYYRMDAQIDPGKIFKLPIGDVICPQKLYESKISIFGWIETESEKMYVPVSAKPKIEKISKDERIHLFLRTSVDVENVKWRYSGFDKN